MRDALFFRVPLIDPPIRSPFFAARHHVWPGDSSMPLMTGGEIAPSSDFDATPRVRYASKTAEIDRESNYGLSRM